MERPGAGVWSQWCGPVGWGQWQSTVAAPVGRLQQVRAAPRQRHVTASAWRHGGGVEEEWTWCGHAAAVCRCWRGSAERLGSTDSTSTLPTCDHAHTPTSARATNHHPSHTRTHTHTHTRTHTHTCTHTHLTDLFTETTQVSWYQKGKTNLDFTEARDTEWQWHQLGHMQVCTTLVFYRPDALPDAQPTASKHWRQSQLVILLNLSITINWYHWYLLNNYQYHPFLGAN